MTALAARGLFHVHTTHSHDGKSSLEALARFCVENGFAFACVTDHADLMDEDAVRRLVEDCDLHSTGGIRLVPGLEYAFPRDGNVHLLCLGIRAPLETGSLLAAVSEVRRRGGLAIVAHPSRNGHFIPDEIVSAIDGIEIWNATYDSRYLPDPGSLRLWERVRRRNPKVMAYCGLDMHDVGRFREIALVMEGSLPESEAALLDALRSGHFAGQGRYLSFGADAPPSRWTGAAIGAGRLLLGWADGVWWAFRRGTKAKSGGGSA